jgi:hypothetical protein
MNYKKKNSKESALPKVGKFADNKKNEPSSNQLCPGLARPEDFPVNDDPGRTVHGQSGNSPEERKRLLKPSRNTKRRSETDDYGRHTA